MFGIGSNSQTAPEGKKYERVHLIQRPFVEEMEAMINNPPLGSVTLDITPDMAAEMLTRNTNNRPLKPHVWKSYAIDMEDGKWHYTKVPVIFSASGKLIDGQHRLKACVETGVVFKCDVAFGAPDEAFAYIDQGNKRTPADIFSINGVPNAVLMAAATAKLLNIEITWSRGTGNSMILPAADIYQRYLGYAGLQLSAHYGARFNKSKLIEASLGTALHYVFARKCRSDADEFCEKVATGIGITGKNDPAGRLRDHLINNLAAVDKMSARRKAALAIKAWNYLRSGTPCKRLTHLEEEPFPRAR